MPAGVYTAVEDNGLRATTPAGASWVANTTSSKPPTKPKFFRKSQKWLRATLLPDFRKSLYLQNG